MNQDNKNMIDLNLSEDIWNRVFTVNSLFIIGSREENGTYNLAPKHMGMPMGFSNIFGFVGTPRKATYNNVKREGCFTVSFPSPSQLIISSLAASPREEDQSKPIIEELPTIRAKVIDGEFLKDSYLQLECELDRISGHYGEWELITGKIVAAYGMREMIRKDSVNDSDLIFRHPLLAYLHPDRYATIKESMSFPLPKNFNR